MEYYSSAKRNTFEAVLMRWMNLDKELHWIVMNLRPYGKSSQVCPLSLTHTHTHTHAHTRTHMHTEVKWSEVAQLCPTLCDPMDCGLPGSSFHGIFQARILEWVAISFSRGSSRPRDWTRVSHIIVSRRFTIWATREGHIQSSENHQPSSFDPFGIKRLVFWGILRTRSVLSLRRSRGLCKPLSQSSDCSDKPQLLTSITFFAFSSWDR